MFMKKWIRDRNDALSIANKISTVVIVQTVLLGGALLAASQNHERIVLTPPYLDERVTISYDSAASGVHKKYALYAATLMGNITPRSVSVIIDAMDQMFEPQLYARLRAQIFEQAKELKARQSSIRFVPDKITYDQNTGRTYVQGEQTIITASSAEKVRRVIYEFVIKIDNYQPSIAFFDFYADDDEHHVPE
jgi:conjugal transfer pilus assembly protein TraE